MIEVRTVIGMLLMRLALAILPEQAKQDIKDFIGADPKCPA